MGTVACRACKGSGRFYAKSGKAFDCRACGGTGVNKDLWSTRCERCRTEIIYKAGTNTPQFCKSCRDIDLEKPCAQMGCTNVIRYKVGWKNVSNYCKRCESKRQQGWSASTCPGTGMWGCGKLIWSPPGKRFTLCPDCSAKQKAERESKKRTKPCATPNCRNIVEYQADWDNPPNFCKSCKAKRDKVKGKKTLTSSDVLPGSGRTVGNIGCTHGTVSGPNKYGGQHVTVFSRNLAHHEHYSYDTDIDGNYVPGSAHITDAMAEVLRKYGHDRT